jgi:hypothetical protein
MSNKSIWAGPRLLVPITIDALVVTRIDNGTKFSIQSLELKQKFNSFKPLSPELFFMGEQDKDLPDPGIHLNWALPDGMTKGKVNEDGKVEYPYLPNRWMITRFSADVDADNKPTVKRMAWVVKSDEVSDKPMREKGNPQFIKNNNGVAEIRYIGQWYNLDKFEETGQTSELVLTAVGNSDPLFTAYVGNNSFVFSFLDDYGSSDAHSLSYMVSGWYSNKTYDVLYNQPVRGKAWETPKGWMEAMTNLQWSVGSQKVEKNEDLENAIEAGQIYLKEQKITPAEGIEGKYAAQTLCHGLLFDVKWPGITHEPPSNVPDPDFKADTPTYISAANAATDCLAAFMQWQLNFNKPITIEAHDDSEVEIMLEAFSHNMLNQEGGVFDTPELQNAIREAWFGRLPGGLQWVAQAPPKSGELKPGDTSNSLVQLPDALADELAALNTLQYSYDEQYRNLISRQKQLYADWLKYNIVVKSLQKPVPEAELKRVMEKSLEDVLAIQNTLPGKQTAINSAVAALKVKFDKKFELSEEPANNFYRPTDPVVLINNAKRSFKRGEDIIYSEFDDFLFTRFSGQFIKSIGVRRGLALKTVTARDLCLPLPANNDIPVEVSALLDEAYLLDPGFALAIAKVVTKDLAPPPAFVENIKRQQTLVWNAGPNTPIDQRTLVELSGFNIGDKLFHIPSKIGVWKWVQPWTPLYLEWEVGYIAEHEMDKWEFDGRDFKWKGADNIPQPGPADMLFKGRSILTPKEAVTMRDQLKRFINDFDGKVRPEFAPLKDVLNGVGNWDVLSQTLTGFGAQLMQWDMEQFGYQPQDTTYSKAIGGEAHGMILTGNDDMFFPVRAGFVSFKRLWIVDDFGQIYNLMPDDSTREPIPGIGVRPGNYEIELVLPTCFQLPPRLIQGSRLNFDFVSAANDAVLSSQSKLSSPVCGWLLPNHLNDSLMVYDNGGVFIGELMKMGATGAYHAQWVRAPFDGCNVDGITNEHLKGFVLGILNAKQGESGAAGSGSGKALKNFLQAIDETLWTVDPMGERNNQSLSILVGRPVAVVRAALSLELYGEPGTNMAWEHTGSKDTGGVKHFEFPVQIGSLELNQDGVMGYFANDDYSAFNSVHNAGVKDPLSPAYVVNQFTNVKPAGDTVYVTLLLDPRGAIHCTTGILPVLQTELPELYIGKVLDDMLVEFKSGPTLVDKSQWWLPLPAGVGQQWSWLQPYRDDDDKMEWSEVANLVSANAIPQLGFSPYTIAEGRLKLTGVLGDQLLILFFEVPGQKRPYKLKAGTTVQLSWSSQCATDATLQLGGDDPFKVPENMQAYPYEVTGTRDLTLTVTNAKGQTSVTINIATL